MPLPEGHVESAGDRPGPHKPGSYASPKRVWLACLVLVLASHHDPIVRSTPDRAADSAVTSTAGDQGSLWSHLSSSIEQTEYFVTSGPQGLSAPNRAHNLRTWFRVDGVHVVPRRNDEDPAAWQFTWRLSRWGRAGRLAPLQADPNGPRADGARVTYIHSGHGSIEEWYENRKDGLEQGFTVSSRPIGDGPVILAGQVGGGLRPRPSREEGAIDFLDEEGAPVLRYGALHVWDATGRELPSHLELDGIEVAIVIEDHGATYPLTVDPLMTSPAWTAEGDQAAAELGASVATAGDVNGDGFSDVIVGAPRYDNGQSDEGRAFLYLGSPSGLAETPAWSAESGEPDAHFGFAVGAAGDVNGDGFGDVIVGAELYENGQNDEGAVFVYHGFAGGLGSNPAWTQEGNGNGLNFGYSAATAGDVNGDGFSDVIVGARYGGNDLAGEGRAFVYYGSASGLAATPAWAGESNQAFSLYGSSVGTAGDVNGDGFSDIIVGAFAYDNGQADEGRAFVYHGSAAGPAMTPSWTAESNQASSWYGWSVSTAGDVDGDGFCDVIVGAYLYGNGQAGEGRTYVYRGSGLGLGADPAWTMETNEASAGFGFSVGTAGDVNGDGYADVIVGAESSDLSGSNAGRAYVYAGSAGGLLTNSSYWTGFVLQAGALYGHSVATAGDVNGDGFSDVLVGAHQYDNGLLSNRGAAFLYHGSGDGPAFVAGWTAEGDQVGAQFGSSVGMAGDVNGDGFSDVIVGAHWYANGQVLEGAAFVFLGSASGLTTSAAWSVEGNQAGAEFGYAVGSAGDVNGDGFSDVIVGSPYYDTPYGRVFIYMGSASGLDTSPAWSVAGDQADSFFGSAVGTAGDVNGDGFSDVVVGALSYNNSLDSEGRAFVYHGSSTGPGLTPAWTAEGDQEDGAFGSSVGTAGDVNGDGFSDVVVGASGYDNGEVDEGRAYVFHGSTSGLATTPGWSAESNSVGANFGASVATAGDVNADGFSDIVVGAPSYTNDITGEGAVFVYLGSFAGLVLFPVWTIEGNQNGASAGRSVSSAGDVNGDGYSDVLVGLAGYTSGQTREGVAGVYSGTASGFLGFSPGWFARSSQAEASFGQSVAGAGDVNGDGFSDVIVGSHLFDNGDDNEGKAFTFYGNRGDGPDHLARQTRIDDQGLIHPLGLSDSQTGFKLDAYGRTAAGRGRVRMQHEVKPFGVSFDGAGLSTGPAFDTGIPTFGVGSRIALSQVLGGLNPGTLYHWRLRIISSNPFFPSSPWLSLTANGSAEADLRTAPAQGGVADNPAIAGRQWLKPAAPNPFTTTTRLAYTIPDRGRTRLAIYDVSGRQVTLLTEEVQEPGTHVAIWDGRAEDGGAVPAGVYFSRLEVGRHVETKKVVLSR